MARLFDNPVAVVILVLIIVVVFGWKRLPDAARSLGRSTRILKSELDGDDKASNETVKGETTDRGQDGGDTVPGESSTSQSSNDQSSHERSTSGRPQEGRSGGQEPTSGQDGPQAG